MTGEIVQSRYEQLEEIAHRFERAADEHERLHSQLLRQVAPLRGGSWIGRGVLAFLHEMDDEVLPSHLRLIAAQEEAGRIAREIAGVLQEAEERAAALFQGDGAGMPSTDGASPDGLGASAPAGGSNSSGEGGTNAAGRPSVVDSLIANLKETFKVKAEKGELGVDLLSGSVREGKFLGDHGEWNVLGGEAGVGIKQIDGKWTVGGAGEVYAGKVQVEGALVGDEKLGWTGGVEAKVLSAKGFIGYQDGSVGAEIGGNLVSAKGETGLNIAGANVGVSGEIGLKMELGLRVGKNTSVKLGPISFGINFGSAKP